MSVRLHGIASAARLIDGRLELTFEPALVAHPIWSAWFQSPPATAKEPATPGIAPLVSVDPILGVACWFVGDARPVGWIAAERGASPRAAFDLLAATGHLAIQATAVLGPFALAGPDTLCVGSDGVPCIAAWGMPSPMAAALDGAWQPSAAAIRYAAPELLDGSAPDLKTTLYAIAMVAAEVALGRAVFVGEAADVLEAALVGVRADTLGPPGPTRDLLASALARDVRLRFDPRRLPGAAAEVRADGPPVNTWAGVDSEVRLAPTWLATLREARAARPQATRLADDARTAGLVSVAESLDAAIFRFDRAAPSSEEDNADPSSSAEITLTLRLLRVGAEAGRAMMENMGRAFAAMAEVRAPVAAPAEDGNRADCIGIRDAAIEACNRATVLGTDSLLANAGLAARANRLVEEAREARDMAVRLSELAVHAPLTERHGQTARARVACERARRAAGEVERLVEAARQIDGTARAAEARAASDAVLRVERARIQASGQELIFDPFVITANAAADAATLATTMEAARAARADAETAASQAEAALHAWLLGREAAAAQADRDAARGRRQEDARETIAGLAAEAAADLQRIRTARLSFAGVAEDDLQDLDLLIRGIEAQAAPLLEAALGDPLDVTEARVLAREVMRSTVREAEDAVAAARRRLAAALAAQEGERIRRAAVAAAGVEAGAVTTSARNRVDETRSLLRGLLDDVERFEVSAVLPQLERAAAVLDVADYHVAQAEQSAEQASSQFDPEEARAHARTAASFGERIAADLPEATKLLQEAAVQVDSERLATELWRKSQRDQSDQARQLATHRLGEAQRAREEASALDLDVPALTEVSERLTAGLRSLEKADAAIAEQSARPRGSSVVDDAVQALGAIVAGVEAAIVRDRAAVDGRVAERHRRDHARIHIRKLDRDGADAVAQVTTTVAEETRALAGIGAANVATHLARAHEALAYARAESRRLTELCTEADGGDPAELTERADVAMEDLRGALAEADTALTEASTAAESWEGQRRARVEAAHQTADLLRGRADAARHSVVDATLRAGVGARDAAWAPRLRDIDEQQAAVERMALMVREMDAPEEADALLAELRSAVDALTLQAKRIAAGLDRIGDERRLAAEDAEAVGVVAVTARELAERSDTLHEAALAALQRIIAEADDTDRPTAETEARKVLSGLVALAARARTAAEMVDAGSRQAAVDLVDAQRTGVQRMEKSLAQLVAIADAAQQSALTRSRESFIGARAERNDTRSALAARLSLLAARVQTRPVPAVLADLLIEASKPHADDAPAPVDPAELRTAASLMVAQTAVASAALRGLDPVAAWLDSASSQEHGRLRRTGAAEEPQPTSAQRLRDALLARGLPPALVDKKETPVPIPREPRPEDTTPSEHGRLRRTKVPSGDS